MLKCTVVIDRQDYLEKRPFKTPILPLVGNRISINDETFKVYDIEFVASSLGGEVVDIKILVE